MEKITTTKLENLLHSYYIYKTFAFSLTKDKTYKIVIVINVVTFVYSNDSKSVPEYLF